MAERQVKLEGFSIIINGAFNPAIFQPLWFSKHNLVRPEEGESAKIELIHNDLSRVTMDWFSIQVTQNQFVIETSDPTKQLPIYDIVIGTFKILEEVPIKAFGMNRQQHVQMTSEDEWHRFGDFYVPKGPWNSIMPDPGMRSLLIEQKVGEDGKPRRRRKTLRIEPSLKILWGLFVQVNEHHDLVPLDSKDFGTAIQFVRELQESWSSFLGFSADVASKLLKAFDQDVQ